MFDGARAQKETGASLWDAPALRVSSCELLAAIRATLAAVFPALAAILTDPAVEVYVLYVEGTPAGYAEIDRRDPKAVDLAYFGLLPEFTGKGLGPYLLSAALDIAWSSDPERVTVNTCTLDHPKALPLYQRFGFQPIRQEGRSIRDPRGS